MEQVKQFDFSAALIAMKAGQAVARNGWNGKNMFVFITPGSPKLFVEAGRPLAQHMEVGREFAYGAHIDIHTVDGTIMPWLASQADVLAEDWVISNGFR